MTTTITNASNFAQDIQIALSSLQDLSYVYYEFTDGERMDLQNSSSATTFLARYCYQEALQKAIDDSITSIARDVDSLVTMLMELASQSRPTEKEEQR